MSSEGYISLHRSIRRHWIFQKPIWYMWWTDLLMEAAYKPEIMVYRGVKYTLQPGECHASLAYLSKRWNCHRDTVRNYLRILQEEGMITRTLINGVISIITICNWASYQLNQDMPTNDLTNGEANPETNGETNGEANPETNGGSNMGADIGNGIVFKNPSTQLNNNNTHTQIIGPQEFLKFLSEEQASRMYVEQTAMALHVAADRLREMAAQFVSEMQSREKGYMGLADLKNHFFNWARIEIQKKEQQKRYNNGTKNNANNGNGGAARRAGSGITPRVYGLKE